MTWEPVDQWPDGRAGGVFRGAAEIVVADRGAPNALERLRTWWHSTPDHPLEATVRRAALTPGWLYVEGREGGRRRVRVEAIVGARRAGKRLIYAVADGEDLVVVERRDSFEKALAARLGDRATGWSSWRSPTSPRGLAFATLGALLLAQMGVLMIVDRYDDAMRLIAEGEPLARPAAKFYSGFGFCIAALMLVTFQPRCWLADSVGLTSVRGLFGWVTRTHPVEKVRAVRVETETLRRGKESVYTTDVEVEVAGERARLRVSRRRTKMAHDASRNREEAEAIARRLRQIFGLEG
ncbi:MAG: hypothetical protein CMN30_02810 [Sandaracinus sp.]|nr:hypothetical protein [Sandaracinus sp.]